MKSLRSSIRCTNEMETYMLLKDKRHKTVDTIQQQYGITARNAWGRVNSWSTSIYNAHSSQLLYANQRRGSYSQPKLIPFSWPLADERLDWSWAHGTIRSWPGTPGSQFRRSSTTLSRHFKIFNLAAMFILFAARICVPNMETTSRQVAVWN
jgi:hypothetical protein